MSNTEVNKASHPLSRVITSNKARQWIWGAYIIAGVALGSIAAGFGAMDKPQPEWLIPATAVMAYLSIPMGSLAMVNVPTVKSHK